VLCVSLLIVTLDNTVLNVALPTLVRDLGHLARTAFASGMDLGLTVGACVAAVGCLVALLTLPSREPPDGE
jgi:hypothetical protein